VKPLVPSIGRKLRDRTSERSVRIITSDDRNARHQGALSILKSPSNSYVVTLPKFWIYLAVILFTGLVGAAVFGLLTLVISAPILLVLVLLGVRRRPKDRYLPLAMKIMHVSQLVHVKLYVIDKHIAIAGSANLTFSGMNRNIERIEVKTLPAEVLQEIDAFSSVWGNYPSPILRTEVTWKNKAIFKEISTP